MKPRGITGILLPLFLSAAPVTAFADGIRFKRGEKFDLICDEHYRYASLPSYIPKDATPFPAQETDVYLINLKSMTYCWSQCSSPFGPRRIPSASSSYLVLYRYRRGTREIRLSDGYLTANDRIYAVTVFPAHRVITTGYCRKAPYGPHDFPDPYRKAPPSNLAQPWFSPYDQRDPSWAWPSPRP